MAAKASSNQSSKVTFGVKRKGTAKKSYNKHTKRPKKYRGQGRQLKPILKRYKDDNSKSVCKT